MGRGDPIFYHARDVVDDVIAAAEADLGAPGNARYSHVAVQISDGDPAHALLVAEAVAPVVRVGPHPIDLAHDYPAEGMATLWNATRCEDAVAWLISQAGRGYGYSDILADAARVLKLPLALFDAQTWDCSHTVFVYMTLAGEDWVASGDAQAALWVANPQQVTPADLARYCRARLSAQKER